MSDRDEPVRLVEGGSPDVRELLRAARLDEPSPAALDRLSARLAPALGAPRSASLLARARPWLAVVVAGAIGAGALMWSRRGDRDARPAPVEPRAETAPPVVSLPAPPGPAPAPQPAPPEAAPAASLPAAERTASPPARRTPRRTDDAPPTPPPAAAAAAVAPPVAEPPPPATVDEPPRTGAPRPREIDLLAPAHDALGAGDPAAALDHAARHGELYPHGAMAEERDALIIEGLLQLGHRDAARQAFARFSTAYPRSGYRARLQRLLGIAP